MPISGEDVFDLQIFAETAQEPGTEPVGVSQGESQGEPQPEQNLEDVLASIFRGRTTTSADGARTSASAGNRNRTKYYRICIAANR